MAYPRRGVHCRTGPLATGPLAGRNHDAQCCSTEDQAGIVAPAAQLGYGNPRGEHDPPVMPVNLVRVSHQNGAPYSVAKRVNYLDCQSGR